VQRSLHTAVGRRPPHTDGMRAGGTTWQASAPRPARCGRPGAPHLGRRACWPRASSSALPRMSSVRKAASLDHACAVPAASAPSTSVSQAPLSSAAVSTSCRRSHGAQRRARQGCSARKHAERDSGTLLSVCTQKNLLAAPARCWAALQTEPALDARPLRLSTHTCQLVCAGCWACKHGASKRRHVHLKDAHARAAL